MEYDKESIDSVISSAILNQKHNFQIIDVYHCVKYRMSEYTLGEAEIIIQKKLNALGEVGLVSATTKYYYIN